MYQVKVMSLGFAWFLRGTTWTSAERAQAFATESEAREALANARKFMKPALFKLAQIIEV